MARKNKPTRNGEFWESAKENNISFDYYYRRLTELAISMFEWKNLPETVDERFLELTLFGQGMAIFFKDDDLSDRYGKGGYLALQTKIGGRLDIYRIPMTRTAYAPNGYNYPLNEDNSVLIFNNLLRTPCVSDVSMFATRLYDLDRTIDINAKAQKTPILIKCAENERLSMKNMYKDYDGNAPVIWGTKAVNADNFTVLKTDSPFVADKIYTLKTQIWNEALTYLGITNLNIQKKERLVSDEVTRNLGGTIASRHSRLQARKQACEKINKMFGLDIDCDYRVDFRETDGEIIKDSTTEVVENVDEE